MFIASTNVGRLILSTRPYVPLLEMGLKDLTMLEEEEEILRQG